MPFTATARIPTRPLSYENKDLAEPKELLVDYSNGAVYVKKEDGEIVGITSAIITEIIKELEKNPELGDSITITIDGEVITITDQILKMLAQMESFQKQLEELGIKVDESGQITINISSTNVTETPEKQFVSEEEKAEWDAKSKVFMLTATVRGGSAQWTGADAPYTQRVDVPDMKETMNPVIDVALSTAYQEAMTQLDNFAYIYKIDTFNGYMTVYASQPTEVNLTLNIKCDENSETP